MSALSKELSKSIADIDLILANPGKEGLNREMFVSLRNRMEALRAELETPALDPKLWEKRDSPS